MNTDRLFITLSGTALCAILLMLFLLIGVVVINGAPAIWPHDIAQLELKNGEKHIGEVVEIADSKEFEGKNRLKLKVGNRDFGALDFRWFEEGEVKEMSYPLGLYCLERHEYGNFYAAKLTEEGDMIHLESSLGQKVSLKKEDIVRSFQPNDMGLGSKLAHYFEKFIELLWDNPREANTEGGLFPSIFGTILLVFIMSVFSFPFGVIAGVYLKEYAKDGPLLRIVHIAVNNLAGIPSIVFGMFGLGFFVYGIGGQIDDIFFSDMDEAFLGTGGLFWASLTLGLLTVPVVIVSTEEALATIPKGIRESALSLGASPFQTLTRVLLPMASPGIMTGFILAMSRAAGEVAPLMLTGVVKHAHDLPLSWDFPTFGLEKKFMHLGFHIYDMGFQSPNVEAAKPMVYVTTLLLLVIVVVMSSLAIILRSRMKKKFTSSHI